MGWYLFIRSLAPFAERDLWNMSRGHSGLMLAPRITFAHFAVSSAMSFSKSGGEPLNTVPPCSTSRALIIGSATAALICLLSFSTISADVLLGAPTPYHVLAS